MLVGAITITFATVASSVLLIAPRVSEAQSSGKMWRIGVLQHDTPAMPDALHEGLRQLGYAEGRNVSIQVRDAEGRGERLSGLATELVRLNVDIIAARGTAASRAAKEATSTIPIVMAPADDPVGTGLVASLSRPGGNITGVSVLSWEADAKRMQLLREMIPRLVRVAVLWTPVNPGHRRALKELEAPALSLGVQLRPMAGREPADLDAVFSRMVAEHVEAVTVLGDQMLSSQRRRIIDLAATHRLPATYFRMEFVEAGGLMSHGTNINELLRRAALLVDKILRGARPGDLPIEQPTKFELAINRVTARTLGLTIPPSLLLQADQVIE
jgi:putative ABC transport system substrate-binding protein